MPYSVVYHLGFQGRWTVSKQTLEFMFTSVEISVIKAPTLIKLRLVGRCFLNVELFVS